MNVTFLSSTSTFAGIDYNMSKVQKNSAEILSIENMPGLSRMGILEAKDYIDYMKAWSDRNSRVGEKQFHVAISCKGKERTKEELLLICKDWMKQMGYGSIPAMYVFHDDTDNNHVHIISSRIDEKGKKVIDSHERRKGRTALLNLANIDLVTEGKKVMQKAAEYRFTTKMQYIALLELKGYKCKEEDGLIKVYKEGKFIDVIDSLSIDSMIKNMPKVNDTKRKAQLRAFIEKYKEKVSIKELSPLMKRYFGVEVKFFGNNEKPYGYMIVDHSQKTVYKGGEILPIKELLLTNKEETIRNVYPQKRLITEKQEDNNVNEIPEYISSLVNSEAIDFKGLNEKLKAKGYYLKHSGELYHYGKVVSKFDDNLLGTIRRNEHLGSGVSEQIISALATERIGFRGVNELIKPLGYYLKTNGDIYRYGKLLDKAESWLIDEIKYNEHLANKIDEKIQAALQQKEPAGFKKINEMIKPLGYFLKPNGSIYRYGQKVDKVEPDILKQIKHNEHLSNKIEEKIQIAMETESAGFRIVNAQLKPLGYFLNYNGDLYHYWRVVNKVEEEWVKRLKDNDHQSNNIDEKIVAATQMGRTSFRVMNGMIKKLGYFLSYNGDLYYYGETVGKIDDNLLEGIKYDDRLEKAGMYKVSSLKGLEVLANKFHVNVNDLHQDIEQNSEEHRAFAQSRFNEGIASGDLFSYLNDNNLRIAKLDGELFLIDDENRRVDEIEFPAYARGQGWANANAASYGGTDQVLNDLLGINANNQVAASSEDNRPRKRKR